MVKRVKSIGIIDFNIECIVDDLVCRTGTKNDHRSNQLRTTVTKSV